MGKGGIIGAFIIGIIAFIIIAAIVVFLVTLFAPVLIGLIILAILIGVGYWIFGKIRGNQRYEIKWVKSILISFIDISGNKNLRSSVLFFIIVMDS